ncbi:hypothetical protein H2203_006487 [Taxawa tesnikishii (nom. ined.)]|nr:hypothetical protein H2203_006487 [Dothideales sp. JES 119]
MVSSLAQYSNFTGPSNDWISTVVEGSGYAQATAWFLLALWLGLAPAKTIQNITAVPAKAGSGGILPHARPTLRFTPIKLFPGRSSRAFEVPMAEVFSDRYKEPEIEEWHKRLTERRSKRSRLGNYWDNLAFAISNTFSRRGFARLRVGEYKNWKLDMRDCKTPQGAKVLDQLIQVDETPMDWRAKLMR